MEEKKYTPEQIAAMLGITAEQLLYLPEMSSFHQYGNAVETEPYPLSAYPELLQLIVKRYEEPKQAYEEPTQELKLLTESNQLAQAIAQLTELECSLWLFPRSRLHSQVIVTIDMLLGEMMALRKEIETNHLN